MPSLTGGRPITAAAVERSAAEGCRARFTALVSRRASA